ncbi:MAG: phosphatidate cytidylyltransferase [Acidobacteriota bacterium]
MTRILSALVLLPLVVSGIWFAPQWAVVLLVEAVLVAALVEYADLYDKAGVPVPRVPACAAAAVTCAGMAWPGVSLDLVLVAIVIAVCAAVLGAYQPAPNVPASAAAALFPAFYLGVPLGCLAAIRGVYGREALLLMLATVWVSDTAQYYTGRAFGRHALSPTVSPKKTVEGAMGGFVAGVAVMVGLGRIWLPAMPTGWLAGMGAVMVGLGIAGDLFESLLKRSAQVKDSSGLIPGHGGVLDRIDALLFVGPGFYLFLRLLT